MALAIDPKWLVELAPKFYKKADSRAIAKNRKGEQLQPLWNYKMPDDSWKMSKRKGWF